MKNKAFIRIVVLAAIFAWPAVEAYRYSVAKKQLAASEEIRVAMGEQVAQARAKHSAVARTVLVSPKAKQ